MKKRFFQVLGTFMLLGSVALISSKTTQAGAPAGWTEYNGTCPNGKVITVCGDGTGTCTPVGKCSTTE